MKNHIGKQISIILSSGCIVKGELVSDKKNWWVIQEEKKQDPVYVIKKHIAVWKVKDIKRKPIKPRIYLFHCENQVLGCGGVNVFRIKDEAPQIQDCPLYNKQFCDCGRLGDLYTLPPKIVMGWTDNLLIGKYPDIKEDLEDES